MLSNDVASELDEFGVVENVVVAVGTASIALPVPELQTTSGLVSAMSIYGSRSGRTMSPVILANWAW